SGPVDLHFAARLVDRHRVPRQPDYALNEVAVRACGRAEDNHVAPVRCAPEVVELVVSGIEEREEVEEAEVYLSIGELIHDEIFAVREAGVHAVPFDLEVLEGSAHREEDQSRQQQRLRNLSKRYKPTPLSARDSDQIG